MSLDSSLYKIPIVSHPKNKTSTLGEVIGQARRKCGFTQQQLAQQLGIAYSTLTKIERGAIKKPNVFLVLKLARAVNIKIEDLVMEEEAPLLTSSLAESREESSLDTTIPQNTTIKFVYFDLHGVLIAPDLNLRIAVLAARTKTSTAFVENLFLRHNKALYKGALNLDEFNHILRQELGDPTLDWLEMDTESVQVNQDVMRVCHQVMESYPVGLLTDVFPNRVQRLIEKGMLPDNFKVIVDSSEVQLIKSDPKIYEYAQRQAGVKAKEILFIDDDLLNITLAQSCGWQSLLLNSQTRLHLSDNLQKILDY